MPDKQNIFLIDFDGTIIYSNISEYVLEEYTDDRWKYYHELLVDKKITLEQANKAQYSLIKTPINEILKKIKQVVKVRVNFVPFIEFLVKNNFKIVIVSGGMDFIIQNIIESLALPIDIEIVAPVLKQKEDNSIEVTGPKRFDNSIQDYKLDYVQYYKKRNYTVFYVGDSHSDYDAVLGSDFSFAVKDTSLATFCKEKKLKYKEFSDFAEIKTFLEGQIL